MIPKEVLESNPAIREKIKELSVQRICRLCLSEEDTLVDIDVVWKMKITSCFPMVTVGSDRLPKFICEPCGKFVKRCYEFRQLCKKTEQMLVTYPLTGSWSEELAIPRWLREEDNQKQSQAGMKRKLVEDLVDPQVGRVRVRSHESMVMSLQSPTITPGPLQQIYEQSQGTLIDSHPTFIRQLEQPTITPTFCQPNYTVPVIQSAPVSYNSPASQLTNPTTNIIPVSQPPQKIQRTNSIQSMPHPGNSMQQHTPQLVGQPQMQFSNNNLNNMAQMLNHPSINQQQFTNLNAIANSIQYPSNYMSQNSPPFPNYPQPQAAMTQNPPPYPYQTPPRPQEQPRPNHPNPTNIWCHECNYKFLTVDHYNFHIRKHNTNPVGRLTDNVHHALKTCRWCTATKFPTHEDLLRHLELHERVGLSKACDFCVKIFADEQLRAEHYRKQHGVELRQTLKLNGQ